MALSAEDIAANPALLPSIRAQSTALVQAFEARPRIAAVFATQQRWLMAHAALAMHFRHDPANRRTGLTAERFFDIVRAHRIASRNTADAFVKEMLKYGIIEPAALGADKRVRPMLPAQPTLEALWGWAAVHLSTLDSLDGGGRLALYLAGPDALARLEPLIADRLLVSPAVRQPQKTFSLFTWLNNGGVVMDWLIAGMTITDSDAERIPTGVLSIADMAGWLKLSRSHLSRKLREAEAMGSLGWEGERGHSRMWVSKGFRSEYVMAQAVKLSIIDSAFEAAFIDVSPQTQET